MSAKRVFYGPKNYDAERRLIEFFIKGLRVRRVSVAKSFGLAGERHCKRGIFPVEVAH